MDAHDFHRYLEQPGLLASTPFADLERLTEQYPYVPNLHLLILLKAHREQHPKLAHYLSQFAAATFDRPHLYNLLHRLDQQAEDANDTLELIALEELELIPLAVSAAEELPSRLNEITVTPPPPVDPTPVAPPRAQLAFPPLPLRHVHWVATAVAFTELLPLRTKHTQQEPQDITGPQALTQFAPILTRYRQTAPLHERLERLRWQPAAGDTGEGLRTAPVASETLADLLVRQEQYGHAIRMYERLQLRYPEKKAIFAARIQELKEL